MHRLDRAPNPTQTAQIHTPTTATVLPHRPNILIPKAWHHIDLLRPMRDRTDLQMLHHSRHTVNNSTLPKLQQVLAGSLRRSQGKAKIGEPGMRNLLHNNHIDLLSNNHINPNRAISLDLCLQSIHQSRLVLLNLRIHLLIREINKSVLPPVHRPCHLQIVHISLPRL